MILVATFEKLPAEILDFDLEWLAAASDPIAEVEWEATPGITVGDQELSGIVTKIWLSGGTATHSYFVTCTIRTNGGRTYERTFELRVLA